MSRKINLNKVLKRFASLKLAVICLITLIILVFWGTIYQTNNGLYQAQQKFFYSWYFLAFGFIPFPGTILISFILTLNLIASIFYRIGFKLRNIGNFITHFGLIILFIGSAVTLFFSVNSTLILSEGQRKHFSSDTKFWEVALWEETSGDRMIFAFDSDNLKSGSKIKINDFTIEVENYFTNCSPDFKSIKNTVIFNYSGIKSLNRLEEKKEISKNIAGIIFKIDKKSDNILLFGRDKGPTRYKIKNKIYDFNLRKKTYHLPISVKLKDFIIKKHPNSEIVKSYESIVEINNDKGTIRDVKISMNKPLRYEDLTFFQSSYYISPDGREYSIFSVVKNSGRLLPYISGILIFTGLLIHFIMAFYGRKKGEK